MGGLVKAPRYRGARRRWKGKSSHVEIIYRREKFSQTLKISVLIAVSRGLDHLVDGMEKPLRIISQWTDPKKNQPKV
jgi:hypothetical protein